jgi:hypothetical protein
MSASHGFCLSKGRCLYDDRLDDNRVAMVGRQTEEFDLIPHPSWNKLREGGTVNAISLSKLGLAVRASESNLGEWGPWSPGQGGRGAPLARTARAHPVAALAVHARESNSIE